MEEKVLYVGIDIAKLKFDAAFTFNGKDCIYCQTIENNKAGFKKFVQEIKKIQSKKSTYLYGSNRNLPLRAL